jgi:hypothetical protein
LFSIHSSPSFYSTPGPDVSGNPGGVKQLAQELLASPLLSDAGIQVAAQNLRAHAVGTGGGKLWQARLRTRDLMRIMDCVQVRAPRALKPREGGDLKKGCWKRERENESGLPDAG